MAVPATRWNPKKLSQVLKVTPAHAAGEEDAEPEFDRVEWRDPYGRDLGSVRSLQTHSSHRLGVAFALSSPLTFAWDRDVR